MVSLWICSKFVFRTFFDEEFSADFGRRPSVLSIQAADLIETELLLLRHKVIDLAEQFEQSSNVPLILFLCVGGKHGIGICHWRSAPFQPPTQRCMQCTKFTKWPHGDLSCEIRSGH